MLGGIDIKADLVLRMFHDGQQWVVVEGGKPMASGPTLDDIDFNLKGALAKSGRFAPGSRVKVLLKFDYDTIPSWYHQYQQHYFNREVTIEL